MNRELLAMEALSQIPKILTLLDRNRHSPTYGCFDRNFWHYKIIDFPSGMSQEFVLPLALVHHLPIPDNPYRGRPAIREWVVAGLEFAARTAHGDGSTDDYFPFEKAGGASAFSLLAGLEAYRLLALDDGALCAFFAKRADWLANTDESGRLTNHQALIALCLRLAGNLVKTDKWDAEIDRRLERILSWQNQEGWFQEYEGCDPAYQTLTISLLAWLFDLAPRADLKEAITQAVRFVSHFVYPDGSFGGELGSRNCHAFFPHGFELVGRWLPEALAVNDRYLRGLANGLGACHADDHLIGHQAWNFIQAWRDFAIVRPPRGPLPEGRHWFQAAGLLIDRRRDMALYAALNKGGAFKFFRAGTQVVSDTQVSVKTKAGNAVGHLIDDYKITLEAEEIIVEGSLGWAKQKQMTTANLVVLRLFMVSLGRFCSNLVRKVLQSIMITGKREAPFRFTRRFRWEDDGLTVEDRIDADSWNDVLEVGFGCDQTSIYVANSRTFQKSQLAAWTDLTEKARTLKQGETLTVVRKY